MIEIDGRDTPQQNLRQAISLEAPMPWKEDVRQLLSDLHLLFRTEPLDHKPGGQIQGREHTEVVLVVAKDYLAARLEYAREFCQAGPRAWRMLEYAQTHDRIGEVGRKGNVLNVGLQ